MHGTSWTSQGYFSSRKLTVRLLKIGVGPQRKGASVPITHKFSGANCQFQGVILISGTYVFIFTHIMQCVYIRIFTCRVYLLTAAAKG